MIRSLSGGLDAPPSIAEHAASAIIRLDAQSVELLPMIDAAVVTHVAASGVAERWSDQDIHGEITEWAASVGLKPSTLVELLGGSASVDFESVPPGIRGTFLWRGFITTVT